MNGTSRRAPRGDARSTLLIAQNISTAAARTSRRSVCGPSRTWTIGSSAPRPLPTTPGAMTSEAGDWEPLLPMPAAAHPGEAAAMALPTAAAKSAAPLRNHAPVRVRPPRVYERLRLDALQQLMQGAGHKDSFDAALNQSLRRQDRQQQAQQAEFAATAVHATSSLQGPQDVPLPASYQQGRDQREDEPWFRDLPAAEQQRLHQSWLAERQRFTGL